jgi:hypothetical protein
MELVIDANAPVPEAATRVIDRELDEWERGMSASSRSKCMPDLGQQGVLKVG